MPGQRAAAAALWQALNAQPQDMARDSQRLKSLEADVAGMLAQGRKTETAITDLRGQLEQARGERYANGLVYALGGFLVLALAIAVSCGMRSRQPQAGIRPRGPWWGDGGGRRQARPGERFCHRRGVCFAAGSDGPCRECEPVRRIRWWTSIWTSFILKIPGTSRCPSRQRLPGGPNPESIRSFFPAWVA
jgi:hypothetical protein